MEFLLGGRGCTIVLYILHNCSYCKNRYGCLQAEPTSTWPLPQASELIPQNQPTNQSAFLLKTSSSNKCFATHRRTHTHLHTHTHSRTHTDTHARTCKQLSTTSVWNLGQLQIQVPDLSSHAGARVPRKLLSPQFALIRRPRSPKGEAS